jgi:hypothetical protein
MNTDDLKARIRAGNFVDNNGRVLRTINILRTGYNKLKSIKYALEEISESEFLDSVNYLHEEGYIHLRNCVTKDPAVTGLADTDYKDLEGKLTGKGIKLLAGGIDDSLIKS